MIRKNNFKYIECIKDLSKQKNVYKTNLYIDLTLIFRQNWKKRFNLKKELEKVSDKIC